MERNRVLRENSKQVYTFINDYIARQGFAPSMDEIADACYLSRSSVVRYLDRLEAWGLISREPGVPRSLRVYEDERGKLRGL
jgi:repressor LexA